MITREPSEPFNQSNAQPNPMFDFLTGFAPRKLKDLFRWTEFLYYRNSNVFAAQEKLSDYVITDLSYETDGRSAEQKYTDVFSNQLKLKPFLKVSNVDLALYGNIFVSVYHPFKRLLKCNHCSEYRDLRALDSVDYKAKKLEIQYTCPSCDRLTTATLGDPESVKETAIDAPKQINLIRWDPRLIDIDYNPYSGDADYYYTMPEYLRDKINRGDRMILDSTPWQFLAAARDKYIFKFDRGSLFHGRVPAPAGIDSPWGFPLLTSCLYPFFYGQVLRKANEAIALDYIVPFRVLHPAQSSGAADPTEKVDLYRWQREMKTNLQKWRRDPLHMMFAPVPLGVTQMGGQGRTLLTLAETKDADETIMACMGIPRELMYGSLQHTASPVMLRLLENQMLSRTAAILELGQWIVDDVSRAMNWKKANLHISNFKFIDDVQQKVVLLQANQEHDFLSKKTIAETYSVDLEKERAQKKQEILNEVRENAELEKEIHKIQTALSEQAYDEASGRSGLTYDQQAVIASADELVDQLLMMPEGTRRSQLASLQAEDYVMYSVVIQRLEQADVDQRAQMREQAPQGGGY